MSNRLLQVTLRARLHERREKLAGVIRHEPDAAELQRLLLEVDAALARMNKGVFGICEKCHDPIEEERLTVDPLVRYCIPDMTEQQQAILQQDLNLAVEMHSALLPSPSVARAGWNISRYYEPAGPVGGDYCDLINAADSDATYFVLADVSGKGFAPAMLVGHLHAMFRSLIPANPHVAELVERVNRIFCESTMPAHYATLLCGWADEFGTIEFCNAGHCQPIVLGVDGVRTLDVDGMPVGLFYASNYSSQKLFLNRGETLFLYTDGLSEGKDATDAEFGAERIIRCLEGCVGLPPKQLAAEVCRQLGEFRGRAAQSDDITLMVISRA